MNKILIGLACSALAIGSAGTCRATETLDPASASIVIDCAKRTLPAQHQVGRMLDQDNFGQVYASRARLMGEVGRACKRAGVGRVAVVPETGRAGDAAARGLARQQPPPR